MITIDRCRGIWMASHGDDGVNPVRRIVRANPNHKTRFHDEQGNLVDVRGACYAPRAFAEAVLKRTVGYRPCMPWLSYRAIRTIEGIVGNDTTVLEYGSGISTVWFAERCRFVCSIDDDPGWHEKVRALLESRDSTTSVSSCGRRMRSASHPSAPTPRL